MDWIGDKLSWLDEKISGVPVIGSLYSSVKGWAKKNFTVTNLGIGGNATGTSYFSGGWTRINERGGEIVNLPGGTQIIPHDVSQRMVGGRGINVYLTIQGNVIGNKAYAEELGEIVGRRILLALRNT